MPNYTTQILDKEERLLEESLTSATSQGLTTEKLQAETKKLQSYTVQNQFHTNETKIQIDDDLRDIKKAEELCLDLKDAKKQIQHLIILMI
ncbi:hypothetical protein [Chryseobacterium sp. SL1]|uniref:hypothetical protein n=1 Tax=Chryseobacterium sp. SL1 TaxID=2995159 RepID=UPI002272D87D|nr:hypothetical protein [Chryseobacterium sp. SL1]MCY1660938.1 hypothetical protein [Chryseobacterium sp. SL1]